MPFIPGRGKPLSVENGNKSGPSDASLSVSGYDGP
jgi:hypothetical protein